MQQRQGAENRLLTGDEFLARLRAYQEDFVRRGGVLPETRLPERAPTVDEAVRMIIPLLPPPVQHRRASGETVHEIRPPGMIFRMTTGAPAMVPSRADARRPESYDSVSPPSTSEADAPKPPTPAP